jgi:SIR2-like domain
MSRAQREGRLLFVLGAGINAVYGLPSWDGLIQELLTGCSRLPKVSGLTETHAAAVLRSFVPDALLQAAVVRRGYPSQQKWSSSLEAQLRERPGKSAAEPGKPLRQITDMLVEQYKRNPSKHIPVLTFNYDDLLERSLAASLIEASLPHVSYHVVTDGSQFMEMRRLPGIYIYHLHGFIDHADRTILDAQSFQPVLAGNHWSWDCLEHFFTDDQHLPLFIGLSLSDPSLRYLLTKWAARREPVAGVYIAAPPVVPKPTNTTIQARRELAFLYRELLTLYDEVLRQLLLVAYHVSSWDEIVPILQFVQRG